MSAHRPVTTDYRARIFQHYSKVAFGQSGALSRSEFDRWGSTYRYYLREWLPENLNAVIVDVGCGSGRLLALLKELGYRRISGVDISPSQVAQSRQIGVDVCERDILEYLAVSESTFDIIIGLDIIEHFLKHEVLNFLDLSLRALRPGGRIILQTPNAESPWGGTYRYGDFTHEVAFTAKALDGLLRLSGFVEVETRETGPVPLGHSLASSFRFVAWQAIRTILLAWNLAETGFAGSKILTRNLLISARKV